MTHHWKPTVDYASFILIKEQSVIKHGFQTMVII